MWAYLTDKLAYIIQQKRNPCNSVSDCKGSKGNVTDSYYTKKKRPAQLNEGLYRPGTYFIIP